MIFRSIVLFLILSCSAISAERIEGRVVGVHDGEAPNVVLDDDYIEICELSEILRKATPTEKAEHLRKASEELNILYVGITRAKKALQLNMDLYCYFSGQNGGDFDEC